MGITITAITGALAAAFVHWLSWKLRCRFLPAAVFFGACAALLITLLGLIFLWPNPADIADMVLQWLIVFWSGAVLLGLLHSIALPARWWQGVLSMFCEAGLGLLTLVGVNYGLQYTGLGRQVVEFTSGEFLDRFILFFLVVLGALALIRPIVWLARRRQL